MPRRLSLWIGSTLAAALVIWGLLPGSEGDSVPTDGGPESRPPVAESQGGLGSPPREMGAARRERSSSEAVPEAGSVGFDEGKLIDLGYSREPIRFMRSLWETARDEEQALLERGAKDAWRPRDEITRPIREALRTDLGDDFYDAVLHATGQPNRARIGNVHGSSPAGRAGLEIRDVIVRYDGDRVFAPSDVSSLSRGSDPDREVEIVILRDGEERRLRVDGGPLGVRYFPARERPSPAGAR